MEKTTIVVTARDKFSTAAKCLRNLLKHTPQPYDLMIVMGGVPASVEKKLRDEFGSQARFILRPEFLNSAQSRNLALKEIQTRLAVFVDADVFVRPGWYEPLVRCQLETGADMVGPIILDGQNEIHSAGNDFFITEENGQKYLTMEIRYEHQRVSQGTSIARGERDCLEVHCQLVVCETMRRTGAFDENTTEYHEIDSGLTLAKHGCKKILEPESIVYYWIPDRLTEAEDIEIFRWKWDMARIRESFAYLKEKWGYDLDYRGTATQFFGTTLNKRLNFFARRWPSKTALQLDRFKYKLFARLLGRQ